VGVGVVAIAIVVLLARAKAGPPARCVDGMIPLGARCCGEGQHLDGDRCVGAPTRCARGLEVTPRGCVASPRIVAIAGGLLRVGAGDFEAQGVVTPREVNVASFRLDALEVTEDRWAACVAAKACAAIALTNEPGRAVANLTRDEAQTFCVWAGGRLPTRDELAFAATGVAGRRYAWGDTGAVCRRASWGLREGPCADGATGPELAGEHPDGASPEGALDLAGNVAEWTHEEAAVDAATSEVLGGAWTEATATGLRSWSFRLVRAQERTPWVGARCAYSP
jgi:formylglycine-generating enzyme required for sulfatase activity